MRSGDARVKKIVPHARCGGDHVRFHGSSPDVSPMTLERIAAR